MVGKQHGINHGFSEGGQVVLGDEEVVNPRIFVVRRGEESEVLNVRV